MKERRDVRKGRGMEAEKRQGRATERNKERRGKKRGKSGKKRPGGGFAYKVHEVKTKPSSPSLSCHGSLWGRKTGHCVGHSGFQRHLRHQLCVASSESSFLSGPQFPLYAVKRVCERPRVSPPPPHQPLPSGSPESVLRRHQEENRALCGWLGTHDLKGNGGRRIEAFLLWRKAWAAGKEPETTDITIILGTGLYEVGGSLREWTDLPGEGMEGLSGAQEQQGHLKEAHGSLHDQQTGNPESKDRRKLRKYLSPQFFGLGLDGVDDHDNIGAKIH